MNKRQLAFSIFSDWRKNEIFIDHLIEKRVHNQAGLDKEKKWLTFVLYGTIEKFYSLQFALQHITNKKLNKNKQIIRNILYLASYELLYSNEKAYAIIDQYVQLTKFNKKIYESKIVNGVLRELSKRKEEVLDRINQSNDIQIKYNISNELHNSLRSEHSEENLRNWYSKFGDKSFWVRHNKLKHAQENTFERIEKFESIKNYLDSGILSIQDISAGKVVEYMSPKENSTILDYCSAPGGKSCYIAELTNDNALITATDSDEFRLKKVQENINRLGITSINIQPILEIKNQKFDQVLLDIPCSGLGVLSKRSDMSVLFKPEKLDELEPLQLDILNKASGFVKEGGELIISTCTILSRENNELVKKFIAQHPEFIQIEEPLICLPFDGTRDGSFAIKLKKMENK